MNGLLDRTLTDGERSQLESWKRSENRVRYLRARIVLLAEETLIALLHESPATHGLPDGRWTLEMAAQSHHLRHDTSLGQSGLENPEARIPYEWI